jgi:hypothetical protein
MANLFPKKQVLNIRVKGKCPRGRLKSRWEQQVRKAVTQKQRRPWKTLRRRKCGKIETGAETENMEELINKGWSD